MNFDEFSSIVNYIVDEGEMIKKKYLDEETGPVDYVAIFCRDNEEKQKLLALISDLGIVVQETPTGPNFKLKTPVITKSGPVYLIKVRDRDPIKRQRGAPDFRIKDYEEFKKKYLSRDHFSLIDRKEFEMIELASPGADVLIYFPNIPLTQQLGINTD